RLRSLSLGTEALATGLGIPGANGYLETPPPTAVRAYFVSRQMPTAGKGPQGPKRPKGRALTQYMLYCSVGASAQPRHHSASGLSSLVVRDIPAIKTVHSPRGGSAAMRSASSASVP